MKKLTRKQLLIGAVLLLLVGVLVYFISKDKKADTVEFPSSETTTGTINYGPPTEEEKAETEQHKDDLAQQIQQGSQQSGSQTGKKQVTPIITNVSPSGQKVTVSAFIQGIFEDGGTCTLTITKGSQKIVKASAAFANATTTDCTQFTVNRSEFSEAGEWTATVSYSSQSAEGVSAAKNFTVQ